MEKAFSNHLPGKTSFYPGSCQAPVWGQELKVTPDRPGGGIGPSRCGGGQWGIRASNDVVAGPWEGMSGGEPIL